jgi:hypothetical protein
MLRDIEEKRLPRWHNFLFLAVGIFPLRKKKKDPSVLGVKE